MSFMTGTPTDIVFQEVASDLVSYSNAFLIKSRVEMSNIGGLQAKGVYAQKPVGGYFRVDPTTMQIKVDKNGTIKNYQQEVGNNKKSYKPEDVVHFYIDKEGGKLFGTPRLEAALEDVKMLRKIEGNVLKLIYRYSTPLMQMKIGIPEPGLMATTKEINEARTEVEKLADDGIFITNERTEFNAIGAEGEALDASKYLAYFESRVFSALSLSAAMAGRGGAKHDADSMEEQVHDAVKYYQRAMQTFIENGIITELLLEGGYNPLQNIQDKVHFQFEEINLETKVKMQTHAMNMFQGNAIPFDEMRTQLGLRSDNVDEGRLYDNMIKQPNVLAQIGAKNGTVSSSPSEKKTNGTAKNIISPANQHGSTSAKIKESFQVKESDEKITRKNVNEYKRLYPNIYEKYISARNEICEDESKAFLILPLTRDAIFKDLKDHVVSEALKGYSKAIKETGRPPTFEPLTISGALNDRIGKHLTKLFKDLRDKLKRSETREDRERVFDTLEYRLRFLTDHVTSKACWYSYVKTAAALNIETVKVIFNSGSEDKKEHDKTVNTKNFSLDDIPAFHPYCKCTMEVKKK
nr:MAG TPA: Portal protein [Caudoviricetes sp.]